MELKKLLKCAAIIFVVFFLFTRPHDAAQAVRSAFGSVIAAADSLALFVVDLT